VKQGDAQTTTPAAGNEITITQNGDEQTVDLPNIGEQPGGNGQPQQNIATDIGLDGDKKPAYSSLLNFTDTSKGYAPPVGPGADNNAPLNSSDQKDTTDGQQRLGIFTRLWYWILNLFGFGPAYAS
jgi:hypothetical protein